MSTSVRSLGFVSVMLRVEVAVPLAMLNAPYSVICCFVIAGINTVAERRWEGASGLWKRIVLLGKWSIWCILALSAGFAFDREYVSELDDGMDFDWLRIGAVAALVLYLWVGCLLCRSIAVLFEAWFRVELKKARS